MHAFSSFILSVIMLIVIVEGHPDDPYALAKLRKDMLKDYDPHSRPAVNNSHSIVVTLKFEPVHLTEMNEEKGILTLEGWISMQWEDAHFKWDPKQYDDIQQLHLPIEDIWRPDIKVYNGLTATKITDNGALVLVFSNGVMMWVPPVTMHTICKLNYENYPHDIQVCKVKFGSWTHSALDLDIKLGNETNLLSGMHNTNPNWELVDIKGAREVKFYDCCVEPYVTMNLNVTLHRKANGEDHITTIPQVIAVILILLMFWIPLRIAGCKFALACTALIMETLTILYTATSVPNLAALPYAVYSLKTCLILSVVALLLEVFIVVLSNCNSHGPPNGVVKLFGASMVSFLLCLPGKSSSTTELDRDDSKNSEDWHLVATFGDRFAFLLFFFIFLGTGML